LGYAEYGLRRPALSRAGESQKDDSLITAEGTRTRRSVVHGLDKNKSHHWKKPSLENFTNFVIVLY